MNEKAKQELEAIKKKYGWKDLDETGWDWDNLDRTGWIYISEHQKLSEPFIREFKGELDWLYISAYQTLSDDFIREFKDYVR